MNQKHFVVLFIIIALAGIGTAGLKSFKDTLSQQVVTATPTPTPQGVLFDQDKNNKSQPPQSQGNLPPQKQIKQYRQFPGILASNELKGKKALIETNKGRIEFEIYPEASKAASNFIFLARDGFYDGLIFHRVEKGFVIQGGDPFGNGSGGPGYQFEDEKVTLKYDKGIVAMANAGPNTNGSQFFILLDNHPELPPKYTIFGKVIVGQRIVDQIQAGDSMRRVSIIDNETNP